MKRETVLALFLAALIAGFVASKHPAATVPPPVPGVTTVVPTKAGPVTGPSTGR